MQLPSLIPHRPFADSSRESEDAKSEAEDWFDPCDIAIFYFYTFENILFKIKLF